MRRSSALRWAGYVAFAVVFAIACGFLSHWQFERGAERDQQLALIAANYDADPVPLAELIPVGASFDGADQWHPVALTGEYLADDQLLARNRPRGGTSAFEVLVPFRLDDGRVFLVDRGWVPPGKNRPEPDAVPAAPAGRVTVVARLMPDEPAPRSGRTAPPGQVPTVTVDLVAAALAGRLPGESFVAGVYGVMVSEDPAPAERPGELPSPSDDPGPHLSYAIQWILFAVMGFAFIWYTIRTERKHRREDAEEAARVAAGEPPASVPRASRSSRRRRDRDAEEEDALIDAG